ncbi:thioesterase [Nonomuraea sp. MG754425]|uniref:thioesterase II family protein n=1 Tax=Nonomuraea sp. MG754425 TaxID=2570319 RepID=UPI001F008C80|nr:thioesterase domain-containing protein [Nonomuraea sp. MG754425]MCF6472389.1 thioesterase [Nonomuraea sp. MG754425]
MTDVTGDETDPDFAADFRRTAPSATDWFLPLSPPVSAPIQVFAFPNAGAGAGSFAACASEAAGRIDLWGANLPGREARFPEPPRTDLGPLVTELADALQRYRNHRRPYGIVGYCAGAVLAYLVAAELSRRAATPPSRLVIVSFLPPHRVQADDDLLRAPSEEFWSRIATLGGLPDEIAAQPDARELFEPTIRADFALLTGRSLPRDDMDPLDIPITVLAGRDDHVFDTGYYAEWKQYSCAEFRLRLVPGDHWLLRGDPHALAKILSQEIPPSGIEP